MTWNPVTKTICTVHIYIYDNHKWNNSIVINMTKSGGGASLLKVNLVEVSLMLINSVGTFIFVIVILLCFSPWYAYFFFSIKTSCLKFHFWTYISYNIELKIFLTFFPLYFQTPRFADTEAFTSITWLAFLWWKMGGSLGPGFWQIAHQLPSVSQLFQLRQNSLCFLQPPISYAKW